jgi:hypothetical protein
MIFHTRRDAIIAKVYFFRVNKANLTKTLFNFDALHVRQNLKNALLM